eukprot:11170508-Heterocapsa_arctica.AAC.1
MRPSSPAMWSAARTRGSARATASSCSTTRSRPSSQAGRQAGRPGQARQAGNKHITINYI